MEKAPPPSPAKPPLGGLFYFTLLLPLVLMGVTAAVVDMGNLVVPALGITGVVTLAASAFLAMLLTRRVGKEGEGNLGLALVLFFALQGFYGICFFVGCTAVSMLA